MKNQFKVRWFRTLLVIAIGSTALTFPMWHRLLFPGFWSDTRCVYSDVSGNPHEDC